MTSSSPKDQNNAMPGRLIPGEVVSALARFDAACQSWGWQADQGHIGDDIEKSSKEHTEARDALIDAIANALRAERERFARATPEMIAAAWATWKPRNPKSLGPGPAFVEAINAALAAAPIKKD